MASRADTQLAVFANSKNAMVIFDSSGRCLLSNDATCNLAGLSRSNIMGRYLSDLLPADLNQQLKGDLAYMLERGRVSGEAYFYNSEGKVVPFRYNASAHIVVGCHLAILVRNPDGPSCKDECEHNLSPREKQILQLLALGYSGVDIGEDLCISPETVRVHVRNALRKMQARTRSHAVALALSKKIIELPEE